MKTLVLFTACLGLAHAAPLPPGRKEMVPQDWQARTRLNGGKNLLQGAAVDFGEGRRGRRVEVLNDAAKAFRIRFTIPVDGEVKPADKLLVSFDARCVAGSSADGQGRSQVVVENREAPRYPKLGLDGFEVGAEWETIHLAIPASVASTPGITYASLMPRGRKQTLEIANLRLLNYGADFDFSKLARPRLENPGRSPDAPWRRAALDRIEKIRSTPVHVEVVDASGESVPDAKVHVALKRHAFGFDTAVEAKFLMGPDAGAPKYREMVDKYSSSVVVENDLKPFGWEGGLSNKGGGYRREWTRKSLEWAQERGMWVCGHYLCWGPWEPWSVTLKDQPEAIRAAIMNHLDAVLTGTAGLVDERDAVNHPVGWASPRATVDQAAGADFKLEITEFDVNTNGDEELQADWLRDCLIMASSHPAYRALILWVFREGTGYKPEPALRRADWREKPNAKVWRELVHEQWRTKATGTTDAEGRFETRGHRGIYQIAVGVDGREVSHPCNTEDGSCLLRVVF